LALIRVLFDGHQLGRRQTGNETYVRELLSEVRNISELDLIVAVERDLTPPSYLGPPIRLRRVPRNGVGRLGAMAILARQLDVDLVHAIYFLPPASGRPTVVSIHDISFELFPEFFSRAALLRNRSLIRLSARSATRVVTISETSRRDILERYSVSEERVVVIPCGVSSAFQPAQGWAPYSGGRPLRVLAVGTLEPRKNLLRLLEAIRLVHRQVPISLRVVGPNGYQASRIRARIAEEVQTEVTGWVSEADLAMEYRRADVFAYPSVYEGFGLPVLEAMATGTPVVASTGGAIPEIAGEAALLVDPLDVDGLAEALGRIASDPLLASALRSRGLARASGFTWEKSARAHAELYRDLVTQ
jgi:glycosyltransferase involved in cell wall biosynthesis